MAENAAKYLEAAATLALSERRFDDLHRLASALQALTSPPSTSPSAHSRRLLQQVSSQLAPEKTTALESYRRYGKSSAGGGIRAGNFLFVGGIGGWYEEPNGRKPAVRDCATVVPTLAESHARLDTQRPVAGDITQQTTDALTIIKQTLEAAGTSLEQLLKVQVALVDVETNWTGMNDAYMAFFGKLSCA